MSDEKECGCGRGARGCSRSRPNCECAENASGCNAGSESHVAWGESVAKSAVSEMGAHKAKGVFLSDEIQVKDEDIDGFIEKCENDGRNPLEVVDFIAERNGIDLSSVPIGDPMKLRLHELLDGVVRKVLFVFVSYCADNYGLGVLRSIIGSVGGAFRSGSRSCGAKPVPRQEDEECGIAARAFPVRIVHARIRRSFTW